VRAPPSQSLASRLVARLAAVLARGRLKRSQANDWAVCVSPEINGSRVPKELSILKAALPEAPRRVEGRPAGWVADGTVKEDDPVTWEAPERPVGDSGRRRTGDPLRRAVGSKRSDGRPRGGDATGHRNNACPTGKARRGQTGGVTKRQGSRRAAYERRWRGTESAPGPGGAKAARVERELQEGNMISSAD
jgi:hypothetical protein